VGADFDGQLLLDIYTAATRPPEWTDVVDGLARATGATGCMLFVCDLDASPPWTIAAASRFWRELPDGLVAHYEQHFSHHEAANFEYLRTLPTQVFMSSIDEDPRCHCPPDRPDSVYLREEVGIYARAAARLNDNGPWLDCVALQFADGCEKRPTVALENTRPYLPHLAKTLEIGTLYRRLYRVHAAVLASLDHVRVGMAIVAENGDLIVANRAARSLLEAGDGVCVDASGKLSSRNGDIRQRIRVACRDLAKTASGVPGQHAVQLAVSTGSTRTPLLLELTPLRDGLNELDGTPSATMVMIIDPDSDQHLDTSGLARVHGLSVAESDVCTYLVQGLSTPAIAERRSTTVDTVKTQVARIYRKTDVDGRTALVRRVAHLQPPTDRPPPA